MSEPELKVETSKGNTTMKKLPKSETALTWRVPRKMEGKVRLLVPRSDPYEHEYPMDLLFDSEEQADEALDVYEAREEAKEEGWVLCSSEVIPIRGVR